MDHVLWLYGVTYADQALPQALPCALEAIPHRLFRPSSSACPAPSSRRRCSTSR